ncbi:hypothetical protein [Butyrivibrio sp.]|uniref:hypothetical protein n=1 Tax=Butyrivibrio sp. TaxID=28121 RepID=UPI0025BEE413|nr:hypothetical protein [Butyrivibrio sp.]MBQ7431371.1 hypothetical protein [Butyrivibrio sp.]MBQ9302689.1 hypothetical protein [Butyrivibrio sp.]
MLENPDILLQNATHGNTTFLDKSGKPISVEQMFANPVADLQTAITRVVPHIKRLTPQIHQMIKDIPDRACSPIRKQFYQTTLDMRLEHILEPALHHIQAHDHAMQNQDVTIPMPTMFNHHDPIIETTRRTTQALKHDHVISLPQYFDLINTASSVEIQQGIKESLVQDLIQYSRPCAVQAVQQAAKFFQTDVNISQSQIPIQINYISTPDHQNDVLNITAGSLNQPIIIHLSDLFDAAKHTMMPELYAQFVQDTKTFITERCGIMTFENHTELIADIQTPIQNDHVLDLSDSDDLTLT